MGPWLEKTTTTRPTLSSKHHCKWTRLLMPVSLCLFANLLIINVSVVNSFNLENRLPIIKYGQEGSYFGYSVAEHIEVLQDNTEKKW